MSKKGIYCYAIEVEILARDSTEAEAILNEMTLTPPEDCSVVRVSSSVSQPAAALNDAAKREELSTVSQSDTSPTVESDAEREELPDHIKQDCVSTEAGDCVYWPTANRGYLAAHHLRDIAMYLDEQNARLAALREKRNG